MRKIFIGSKCTHCGCKLWFQEGPSLNRNYRYENKSGNYYCSDHAWEKNRKKEK